MNKTSIDFFSRGLNDKKTRLSINVFGLNARFQQKQSPIKRRPSLSHINMNKFEKKVANNKQTIERQLIRVTKTPNIEITNPSNQHMNIIKNKIFRFQGTTVNEGANSVHHSSVIAELPQVTNKNHKLEAHLQKLRMYRPVKRITQQGEINQSNNTSNQIQQPLKRIHIIDKIKQISKEQYENPSKKSPETKQKPKKYFIHNLVLSKLQNYSENMQRYNSQQKFTIRKMHSNIFLASGGMKSHQSKGKTTYANRNQMKQILLPSSLITNRIGYKSEYTKPVKRKQKSQKAIIHVKKSKLIRQQIGNIDRWQLPRQDSAWQL